MDFQQTIIAYIEFKKGRARIEKQKKGINYFFK